MRKENKVKTLRLDSDVIKKVEELAKEDNRTFSNMVETILIKFKPDDNITMT